MHTTAAAGGIASSLYGIWAIAQIDVPPPDVIGSVLKYGSQGLLVLGIVALARYIVKQDEERKKEREAASSVLNEARLRLEAMNREMASALQRNADALDDNTAVNIEVKNTLKSCADTRAAVIAAAQHVGRQP